MGAAGAGYEVAVLVVEAVLDDYEGHVSGAAGLAVDVCESGGAGEGVAGTDGEKGLDPLAGHVDGPSNCRLRSGGSSRRIKEATKAGGAMMSPWGPRAAASSSTKRGLVSPMAREKPRTMSRVTV